MKGFDEADDPRRRLLLEALAAAALAAALPGSNTFAQLAQIPGGRPRKLGAGESIFRLKGSATVNGREASRETRIGPGDTVRTGRNSEIIFVVGADAMLLRDDSQVVLAAAKDAGSRNPGSGQIAGLKLAQGKLLTVFAPGSRKLQTATASVLIRGTGIYMETDPELSYVCTCYGMSDVSSTEDSESWETVVSRHHDKPLYVLPGTNQRGGNVRAAPFKNHSDQELEMLEALVGRTPPFLVPESPYTAPRRGY